MKPLKISTLLIAILIISNNIVSQISVYKPFPHGNALWSMSSQSISGLNYYNYRTAGDTTIGVYTYKKVTYSFSPNNPFNFGPQSFKFAYRNDSINKKVYYLDVTGGINKDTLWYDFNLNIGDTVKSTYSYKKQPYNGPSSGTVFNRVVQSIDSILICGKYYKRFNFNCIDYASSLTEGVGFMDDFIHTYRDNECPFEPPYVYSTGFSTCNTVGIYEVNIAKTNLHIYPNPVTSDFKINSSLTLSNYTIINNLGEIVQQEKYTNQESILFSEYLSGLYLISLQDEQGNTYHTKFMKQ